MATCSSALWGEREDVAVKAVKVAMAGEGPMAKMPPRLRLGPTGNAVATEGVVARAAMEETAAVVAR